MSHCLRALRVAAATALAVAVMGCGHATKVTGPAATGAVLPASDSAPSWSPDGTRIAYAHTCGTTESADKSGIYIIDAVGGTPVHILTGAYQYPDWSPDGRRLAVTGGGIFTITVDGDSLTRLSSDLGYDVKWSPDGSTLAYQTYDSTNVYRLWLMATDGTRVRCLNASGGESWYEPNWSPNSSQLTHVRSGAGLREPEVFLMDTTGNGARQITYDAFEDRYPAWSPDGEWITWGSWRDHKGEVWLMRSDGAWGRRIASGLRPEWAPDSRHITYTAAEVWNGKYRLYTMDTRTGESRRITE